MKPNGSSIYRVALYFIFAAICSSCGSDMTTNKKIKSATSSTKINLSLTGEELFIKHCKLCHGIDGRMGLNGAKDLNESQLSLEEQIVIITEGKNAMTPFKKVLSKEEIEKVAAYANSFKSKED